VQRLNPGSSGMSAIQMLNKLRDILISEGHLVPPLMGKQKSNLDPSIRGYIRDMTSDRPTDVKVMTVSLSHLNIFRMKTHSDFLKQAITDFKTVGR